MNLEAFLAQNALKIDNIKIKVSDRFLDSDGNPVLWELRAITNEEDRAIRKASTVRRPLPGRKGVTVPETDFNTYSLKSCVASVVYPDLHDKRLQDSYGVMGAEGLLDAMLSPGEMSVLTAAVQELSGFDLEGAVEDAKN